ncbi:MAG: glycosyl hydrolase [Verrucomicrobiia bacterium]
MNSKQSRSNRSNSCTAFSGFVVLIISFYFSVGYSAEIKSAKSNRVPPAPLYRDPVHDGAADPTFIWNRAEKCWWMLYTNRRADATNEPGVKWVHGTDIGLASSDDGGVSWKYRGIARGLEFETNQTRNTFWAPEVVYHNGIYHAYISYVRGIPDSWKGTRDIVHYTSTNLIDWKYESIIVPGSIDACVHRLPDGKWRMWFKNEQGKVKGTVMDSDDLYHWELSKSQMPDPAPGKGEGPEVFRWKGWFWMVKDIWRGLAVYRSADLDQWTSMGVILDKPGKRPGDDGVGQHAGVIVQDDDNAYLIYFVHQKAPNPRRTWLQIVKLGYDGNSLTCDRDAEFEINLKEPLPQFTSEFIPIIEKK